MSIRNLARRKGRNVVTVVAIALATAAFLAAQATTESVTLSINNAYQVYGSDAWVWFQSPVGMGFASTLRSLPDVRQVEPWASRPADVDTDRLTLWGLPPDTGLYNYRERMKAGRWLSDLEPYGAVISSRFSDLRGIAVGDRFEMTTAGRSAWVTVLGIVDDNAQGIQSSSRGKLFLPLSSVQRITNSSGSADFFAVRFSASDGPSVAASLAELERKYRTLSPGILAAYADREQSLEASKILSILLYSMTVIVALIGGIGVANTLTLNVLERRREIGMMRAMGGRNSHLVQVFVSEALLLGAAGFALGLALGWPLARMLVWLMSGVLFPLDFIFPVQLAGAAFLFTLGLTVAASLGPALGAARLKVSQALRYE